MKNIITIMLLSFSIQANATDYYIAANGSDNNNGTSSATPFKTINKLNTLTLKAGDKILFNRNDVFRGQLTVKQSGTALQPILISDYGTGLLPVICGSENINGFTLYSSNIYSASFGNNPSVVFNNSKTTFPARYPNSGFLTVDNANGNQNFYDAALTQSSGYWNGATIHHRMVRWHYGENVVQSFSNGNITLQSPAGYNFTDGWGYYLSNKFQQLDTAGEFFYNTVQKKLYLYAKTQPANNTVEATVYGYGIYLQNANYVQIKNISFRHQQLSGISANGGNSDVSVSYCRFSCIYGRAILFSSVNNVIIKNNIVTDMYNKGITAYDSRNIQVQGNIIKRIGLYAGRATKDEIGYSAMEIEGRVDKGNISFNTFDSIGYLGLRFSTNTLIEKNSFKNFCLTTDDGSAIYTWSNNDTTVRRGTGCIIRNNIIQNGIGNRDATADKEFYANGIYMDDATGYATITNNTINKCSNIGIFLHNSISNTVQGNTVFNCGQMQMGMSQDALSTTSVANNKINGNIFYSINENVYPLKLTNYENSNINYATYSGNYYCNPYSGFGVYTENQISSSSKVSLYTVNQWKTSNDATAKGSYVKWNAYKVKDTAGNNIIINGNFTTNADGWYCWSPTNTCVSSWGTNNNLNGGSFHLKSKDGLAYNTNYFPLNAGQTYQLSFSNIAAVAGSFTVQTMNAATYEGLELSKAVPANTVRTDNNIIFTPTYSNGAARVNFYVNNSSPDYWLDNVKLYKVNTTYDDPLKRNLIFINSTNASKTFPLPQTLYDLDNNAVSGSITLTPYTSKILVMKDAVKSAANNIIAVNGALNIYPNPAKDYFFTRLPKDFLNGKARLTITDIFGRKVKTIQLQNNLERINITGLAGATYFVEIINEKIKYSSVLLIK
jgi:parallel beta-helix repeat protein